MEQTQTCSNCGKTIPESKSATHFGYCRRNIVKCTTCGEMYDKNFLEDHEEEFHSVAKCPHCSKMLKKSEADDHARACLMKPKHCEYCDLNVPAKDFTAHFRQCESRTSQCTLCDKAIVNREFAIHSATCNGKTKPPPRNSHNQLANESNKYNFEDSLSQFWQQPPPQQSKKPTKGSEKQSPPAKSTTAKKQPVSNSTTGKKEVQVKPDFKKADPKALSRQHFYDNYLSPGLSDFSDFDISQHMGQLNFQEEGSYDYLPQESFYGREAFAFQTPSTFEYMSHEPSGMDADEQLIQDTLFESSKRNRVDKREHLPSDFFSEDIMNQSFYKDILDLEKQKAILDDLAKNPNKKAPSKPEPKVVKPIVKAPVKGEKQK